MDYQELLIVLKQKLLNEHPDIIKKVEVYVKAGSTGGEITMMVGKYLKDLKFTNYNAYKLVKKEILDFLSACEKQGLFLCERAPV